MFACGGGGWADHGPNSATSDTVGRPELVIADVLDDAWSRPWRPSAHRAASRDWEMRGVDYVRAVELLQEASDEPIVGLIIGQNGMSSTLNAWLPGAAMGWRSSMRSAICARIRPATWARSASRTVPSP